MAELYNNVSLLYTHILKGAYKFKTKFIRDFIQNLFQAVVFPAF
jgi:hypothetical protein